MCVTRLAFAGNAGSDLGDCWGMQGVTLAIPRSLSGFPGDARSIEVGPWRSYKCRAPEVGDAGWLVRPLVKNRTIALATSEGRGRLPSGPVQAQAVANTVAVSQRLHVRLPSLRAQKFFFEFEFLKFANARRVHSLRSPRGFPPRQLRCGQVGPVLTAGRLARQRCAGRSQRHSQRRQGCAGSSAGHFLAIIAPTWPPPPPPPRPPGPRGRRAPRRAAACRP